MSKDDSSDFLSFLLGGKEFPTDLSNPNDVQTFKITVPCPFDPEHIFDVKLSSLNDKKKVVCPKCQNEYEVFLQDGGSCVVIDFVSHLSFAEIFEQHVPWDGGEAYLTDIVRQMKDTFVEIIDFVNIDKCEEPQVGLNIGALFDEKRIPPSLYKLLEERLIMVAVRYDTTIGRVLNMYRNVKKDEVYKELVNLQLKAEQENMIAGGWLPLWKNLAMTLGLNLKSLES